MQSGESRKRRYLLVRFNGAMMAVCVGISMNASAAPPILKSIHCELVRSANGVGGALELHLRNDGPQPVALLRRNTPLEPMRADFLRVTRNDKRLVYLGPVAKRSVPTLDEYLTLSPGATIQHAFDPSLGYDFSKPGRYRIVWNGELLDAAIGSTQPNPNSPQPARIQCAPVIVER